MRRYSNIASAAASVLALSAQLFREGEPGAVSGTATAAPVAPPAPDVNTQMMPQTFHFKTEKIRDENGKEVGQGKKLPSANLYLPLPTKDRLVQILQGGEEFKKEQELLLQAVQDVVYGVARGQINAFREIEANKETPITQQHLDLSKLDWTAIANMPARERSSNVPSDEDIQAFLDVYLEVMPKALNKSVEKINNHVAIFKSQFKKQRGQKDILGVFVDALAVFAGSVQPETLEDHLPVVEYFSNKLERMLRAEEKITMDDL